MRVSAIVAVGVVVMASGCSKRDTMREEAAESAQDPERGRPGGSAQVSEVVRGRPGNETDEQLRAEVEALEAAAQRGEGQWTTSEGHDLVTLGKNGKTTTRPFPVPKHKSGDSINGAYLAPDGTLFTAGYMITGKPGPDTGAVHRVTPGGAIERVFELPEHELWGVGGRNANDVYAIGPKTVVHWDGHAWTELPIKGVNGTINQVTVTATDVWIVAVNNDPEESRIYRLDGTTWKQDVELPCLLRGLSFADTTAYASGACNTVFRRAPNGTWKNERIPQGGAFDVVAVSPSVAYVAAEQLLRRKPDGTWVVADAGFPRVHGVQRGRGDRVIVLGNVVASGGDSGVALGAGDTFEKLPLENCDEVAASADVTYCIRERRIAAPPPDDLR
jgi:hypothetical protein